MKYLRRIHKFIESATYHAIAFVQRFHDTKVECALPSSCFIPSGFSLTGYHSWLSIWQDSGRPESRYSSPPRYEYRCYKCRARYIDRGLYISGHCHHHLLHFTLITATIHAYIGFYNQYQIFITFSYYNISILCPFVLRGYITA